MDAAQRGTARSVRPASQPRADRIHCANGRNRDRLTNTLPPSTAPHCARLVHRGSRCNTDPLARDSRASSPAHDTPRQRDLRPCCHSCAPRSVTSRSGKSPFGLPGGPFRAENASQAPPVPLAPISGQWLTGRASRRLRRGASNPPVSALTVGMPGAPGGFTYGGACPGLGGHRRFLGLTAPLQDRLCLSHTGRREARTNSAPGLSECRGGAGSAVRKNPDVDVPDPCPHPRE